MSWQKILPSQNKLNNPACIPDPPTRTPRKKHYSRHQPIGLHQSLHQSLSLVFRALASAMHHTRIAHYQGVGRPVSGEDELKISK